MLIPYWIEWNDPQKSLWTTTCIFSTVAEKRIKYLAVLGHCSRPGGARVTRLTRFPCVTTTWPPASSCALGFTSWIFQRRQKCLCCMSYKSQRQRRDWGQNRNISWKTPVNSSYEKWTIYLCLILCRRRNSLVAFRPAEAFWSCFKIRAHFIIHPPVSNGFNDMAQQ